MNKCLSVLKEYRDLGSRVTALEGRQHNNNTPTKARADSAHSYQSPKNENGGAPGGNNWGKTPRKSRTDDAQASAHCWGSLAWSLASVVPPELALGEHLNPWRFVKLYLGQGFLEILTRRQAKSGSQRSHKEFQVVLAVCRNPRTGTSCASEGEPRISGDKSQWTDRYSIASGRSQAPSASTNLLLAISMRSSPGLSSHGESTRTVPEKVHAVPLTRKPLSFP